MIIGLVGASQSGKSSAAKALAKAHGFEVISVASPMRAMLMALGLTPEHFNARNKERPIGWLGSRSPRQLMQGLGDWGREVSPSLWVGLLEARLEACSGSNVVVDDIRFPLEANAVRVRYGLLWRITRGSEQAQAIGTHKSDTAGRMIEVDRVIPNGGGLADLERTVIDAYVDILDRVD